MTAISRTELETLPAGTRLWAHEFRYGGDPSVFPVPHWQGELELVDTRWPGMRELQRDGAEFCFLDFRNQGRMLFMNADGTLEIDERRYARLYRSEHDANRDYAERKNEVDRQLVDLAAFVSDEFKAPLPVAAADLQRPGMVVLEQEHEFTIVIPARDLVLVVQSDTTNPDGVIVRRQRPNGEPLDWASAPGTWTNDHPVVSTTPAELAALLDRLV